MAGVRFKGDSRKLQQLASRFGQLATAKSKAELNRKLAREALELAHDGFDRSITPYGVRWKNPKYRRGQPLRKTRRLESSIRPSATGLDFGLVTNVIYAATHQWGRDAIPQRMFLPNGRQGFGGRWRRALQAIADNHVRETLGR